jgi:hypothetical protein
MKYLGILVFFTLFSVCCNHRGHHFVNICDDPSLGCNVDTTILDFPMGLSLACPAPTLVNFTDVDLSQDKIKLGDSVQIISSLLSPVTCIGDQVKIIRKSFHKHNEFSILLSVDTCGNGCNSTTLSPLNLTWNFMPMDKGEYSLEFINIYGEDLKKKLIVE